MAHRIAVCFAVALLALVTLACKSKHSADSHAAADGGMTHQPQHDAGHELHDDAGAVASDSGKPVRDAGGKLGPARDAATSSDAASKSMDAGTLTCSPACDPGSVCVRQQTVGGALIQPDDAGECPPPRILVPEDSIGCSLPPAFHCASRPAACSGSIRCACAQSLCTSSSCSAANDTLVRCLQLVP